MHHLGDNSWRTGNERELQADRNAGVSFEVETSRKIKGHLDEALSAEFAIQPGTLDWEVSEFLARIFILSMACPSFATP